MIKLNLAKAERKTLEDGDYLARIKVCKQDNSKAGKPKLHIEVVTEGNENPDANGIPLFRDQGIGEESAFYVNNFITSALGVEALEGDGEGMAEFEPTDMEGKMIGVVVGTDSTYDGTPRNQIKSWFIAEEAEVEQKKPAAAAPAKNDKKQPATAGKK